MDDPYLIVVHLDQVGEVLQKGIRVIGHVVHAVNKSLMHFLVVFLAAHGEDCFEFCIVHLPALNVVLLAPEGFFQFLFPIVLAA